MRVFGIQRERLAVGDRRGPRIAGGARIVADAGVGNAVAGITGRRRVGRGAAQICEDNRRGEHAHAASVAIRERARTVWDGRTDPDTAHRVQRHASGGTGSIATSLAADPTRVQGAYTVTVTNGDGMVASLTCALHIVAEPHPG